MNFNNPYYNSIGYNMNYQQPMYRQPVQQFQSMPQQPTQSNFLQGRFVESIDICKNIEIPMDRKCELLCGFRW